MKKIRLNLLKELAITDFKLKYSSSVLGYIWTLLKPLLLFATLYLVFSVFMRFDLEHYQLYLLLGIIVWSYFSEATNHGMMAIVGKAGLVKKAKFPRSILVTATNVTAIFTFLLNMIVFVVFFLFSQASLTLTALTLPLFFIELVIISLGASFFLAALYVKFRDLIHVWEVLLQIGFWLTPIVYPLSLIPDRFMWLFKVNPMARIIMGARDALIYNSAHSIQYHLYTFIAAIIVLVIGYSVFKFLEPKFAEEI